MNEPLGVGEPLAPDSNPYGGGLNAVEQPLPEVAAEPQGQAPVACGMPFPAGDWCAQANAAGQTDLAQGIEHIAAVVAALDAHVVAAIKDAEAHCNQCANVCHGCAAAAMDDAEALIVKVLQKIDNHLGLLLAQAEGHIAPVAGQLIAAGKPPAPLDGGHMAGDEDQQAKIPAPPDAAPAPAPAAGAPAINIAVQANATGGSASSTSWADSQAWAWAQAWTSQALSVYQQTPLLLPNQYGPFISLVVGQVLSVIIANFPQFSQKQTQSQWINPTAGGTVGGTQAAEDSAQLWLAPKIPLSFGGDGSGSNAYREDDE